MNLGEAMRRTQEEESAQDEQYHSSGYLPMDCPVCGRRRLEWFANKEGAIILVKCEKCGIENWERPIHPTGVIG